MSIKPNVAIYLHLARQTAAGMQQIQEFGFGSAEAFSDLLDDAIREGASRGKLEQLIRIYLKRELYERKFMSIRGRNYDMIKYAKMVARTRLRTVQTDGVKTMAKQFDSDLVEISDHGTTCENNVCQKYEGNTYSINGKTPGYDLIPAWPPFHPNCEHSAHLTSLEAIEVEKRYQ